MKYKIGDKVKSLEWYNENKNISGYVLSHLKWLNIVEKKP